MRPKPDENTGRADLSLLPGQLRGDLPVNLKSPNKTSVMPRPSVPGSHAAMNTSLSASAEFKTSGRPENKIVTTGAPVALALATNAAAAADKFKSVRSPGPSA